MRAGTRIHDMPHSIFSTQVPFLAHPSHTTQSLQRGHHTPPISAATTARLVLSHPLRRDTGPNMVGYLDTVRHVDVSSSIRVLQPLDTETCVFTNFNHGLSVLDAACPVFRPPRSHIRRGTHRDGHRSRCHVALNVTPQWCALDNTDLLGATSAGILR